MAMLKAPRQLSKRQEMRQDAVVTFSARVLDFFENNRTMVLAAVGGLVVLILLGVGYSFYQGSQAGEASELLGEIIATYEAGNYQAALDGIDGKTGLRAIADDYSNTPDGNLACFYVADALYNLGQKEEALSYFQKYDKGRDYLGASALAGEAAVYADQENYQDAADRYLSAAQLFENELTSPGYLLEAARNYERVGDYRNARAMYEQIAEDYPESPDAESIDLYLARLSAMEQ